MQWTLRKIHIESIYTLRETNLDKQWTLRKTHIESINTLRDINDNRKLVKKYIEIYNDNKGNWIDNRIDIQTQRIDPVRTKRSRPSR